MDHRNGTGPALERLLQPFAFDPVADPVRQIADHAGIIDVTDGRMVQPPHCFRFTKEPASERWIKVHPQADSPLEDLIPGLEEDTLRRSRDGALEPIARAERFVGAPEILERFG